jgi:DNA repair protein RecO (recombination protein O)
LLATGKSLDIITQGEIRASYPSLRNDLERLARATYLCELLDVFSHERDATASAEAFDLTVSALSLLGREMDYLDGVLHAYELRLLTILGYAPILDHCARCGSALDRRPVGFSPSQGGTLCHADRNRAEDAIPLSSQALDLLQQLAEARASALLSLHPAGNTAAEVDRALRWFIRFRAERSLKSADFLDSLRVSSG